MNFSIRLLMFAVVSVFLAGCMSNEETATTTVPPTVRTTPPTLPPTTEPQVTETEWEAYCAAIEAERAIIYAWDGSTGTEENLAAADAALRIVEAAPRGQAELWVKVALGYQAFAAGTYTDEDWVAINEAQDASEDLEGPLREQCGLPRP